MERKASERGKTCGCGADERTPCACDETAGTCDCGTGEDVRAAIPSDDVIRNLAEVFKVFGDPTRAKILSCLQIRGMCVCELAAALDMSVSAVSHQLRVLRSAKLVKGVKDGKEVKYSLDDDHVTQILACGLAHVEE